MKPDVLPKLAKRKALAPYAEYLRAIARPSVDISLGRGRGAPDKSRFGGAPYVPPDFVWPSHDQGVYRFLGQINLADIGSPPSLLPESGLLCLFYASANDSTVAEDVFDELQEEEWDALEEAKELEIFWRDPGYVRAYYWNDSQGFELRSGTVSWRAGDEYPARDLNIRESKNTAIKLSAGLDLPRHEPLRKDWAFNEEVATSLFDEVRQLAGPFKAHLLGYPTFKTLGYDPTPGEAWLPLLTVGSLLDWCWHDGDNLMVFIEKERLAQRDFSHLKCDAG